MMINENPDFENENEEEGTSGGDRSFTGGGGGLGQAIGKEVKREVTHEVVGGFFSWLGELLSDDD